MGSEGEDADLVSQPFFFFFLIVLFLELCVVTITAIPHERGQQRTNAPIAAQAEIHDTKLVQVPTD